MCRAVAPPAAVGPRQPGEAGAPPGAAAGAVRGGEGARPGAEPGPSGDAAVHPPHRVAAPHVPAGVRPGRPTQLRLSPNSHLVLLAGSLDGVGTFFPEASCCCLFFVFPPPGDKITISKLN